MVVWKFDRFARSVSHLLRALETFRAQGIEFVSFSEQLDTSTKGKRLGRPKKILDTKRIATLRAKGIGWKRIATEMGVGVGTIYRVALEGSKIREKVF